MKLWTPGIFDDDTLSLTYSKRVGYWWETNGYGYVYFLIEISGRNGADSAQPLLITGIPASLIRDTSGQSQVETALRYKGIDTIPDDLIGVLHAAEWPYGVDKILLQADAPYIASASRMNAGTVLEGLVRFRCAPVEDRLQIGANLYGFVGEPINLYFDSVRGTDSERKFNVISDYGALNEGVWTFTPTVAGNIPVTFELRDAASNELISSSATTLNIADATGASSVHRDILLIGDSLGANGGITQALLDMSAANPGAVQIDLMGTVGTSPNLCEAIPGYGTEQWRHPSGWPTPNKFIPASGGYFDASYYLSSTGQAAPQLVLWELGVNDMFGVTNDDDAVAKADQAIDFILKMAGVRSDANVVPFGAGVKHLVMLPPPPNASQDGFGASYGCSTATQNRSQARHKRNIAICQERFLKAAISGFTIVPSHTAIDPKADFPITNGVHPNPVGYEAIGKSVWCQINYMVADGQL